MVISFSSLLLSSLPLFYLPLSFSLLCFLYVLDLMTSVSEQCSRIIVEENVMTVLHDYISHTNRNRASLEVVKVCLQILINITKVLESVLNVVRP